MTEASGPAAVGRINRRIIKTEVFMISYGIAEAQEKDESSSGRMRTITVEKHVPESGYILETDPQFIVMD